MEAEIIIIGGGAAGLMAAIAAAGKMRERSTAGASEKMAIEPRIVVLEKMPRPARKMMISGKGRCNFSNAKRWNEFSQHIRSKSNFLKPAFYNLDPQGVMDLLAKNGLKSVVERGDRVFPESYLASDVVDTLVRMAKLRGVRIETGCEVREVVTAEGQDHENPSAYIVRTSLGEWICRKVIIATGGLSYPTTGSTGDGYAWAKSFGHSIKTTFPSLTAMVPKGYKTEGAQKNGHLDRSVPMTETGKMLCGTQLKNVGAVLSADGSVIQEETGDLDFTDGGIEGPIGFKLSRNCVWSMINGGRPIVTLDLKPGVKAQELAARVSRLWTEVRDDPRSNRLSLAQMYRILLGKLMPRELIAAFNKCHPEILARRPLSTDMIAKALKHWEFPIAGYVGYERCVVTAGGVNTDEVFPKTMESRLQPGLYLAGEVLDIDCDTGGYNMHCAFSTGYLAGLSAAAE